MAGPFGTNGCSAKGTSTKHSCNIQCRAGYIVYCEDNSGSRGTSGKCECKKVKKNINVPQNPKYLSCSGEGCYISCPEPLSASCSGDKCECIE